MVKKYKSIPSCAVISSIKTAAARTGKRGSRIIPRAFAYIFSFVFLSHLCLGAVFAAPTQEDGTLREIKIIKEWVDDDDTHRPNDINVHISRSMLPNEYQEVEYVEGTGTQFVDTGFQPNQDTRMVLDFQVTGTLKPNGYRIIGTENQVGSVRNQEFRFGTHGNGYWFVGYESQGPIQIGTSDNKRHVVDFDKNNFTLDEHVVTKTFDYKTFTAYGNSYMFAINAPTNIDKFKGRIYSHQIYDNGTLVRDFLPCYRSSDGTIGFYELVEGKFYTNNGTGNFLKGPNIKTTRATEEVKLINGSDWIKNGNTWEYTYQVAGNEDTIYYVYEDEVYLYDSDALYESIQVVENNEATITNTLRKREITITKKWEDQNNYYALRPNDINVHIAKKRLPEAYQEVEYIQSSGEQYIDTGFKPNQDTRIVADFQYLNNNRGYRFTGTERRSPSEQKFRFGSYSSGEWYFGYGSYIPIKKGTADSERHILDFDKNVLKLDGDIFFTFPQENFEGYANIYIFGISSEATADYTPAKLYSYKLYDNGTIIRDYIPCYRKSDGMVGLYDIINGEFYINERTGQFTKGADIDVEEQVIVVNGNDWTKNSNNTWEYSFTTTDDDTKYFAYEDEVPFYKSDALEATRKEILNNELTITNTIDVHAHELTLKKQLTGNMADIDKVFEYTIKIYDFNDNVYVGNLPVTDSTGSKTVALTTEGLKVELKHDETVTIGGILAGYKYVIEEVDTDYTEYYEIAKTADGSVVKAQTAGTVTGKETLSESQTVTFVNNKEKPVLSGVFSSINHYWHFIIIGLIVVVFVSFCKIFKIT